MGKNKKKTFLYVIGFLTHFLFLCYLHPLTLQAQTKKEEIPACNDTEDPKDYGMIREFLGRLPVVIHLEKLTVEDILKVLTEPKNSIISQYQKLFEVDGVHLDFSSDALKVIADNAYKKNISNPATAGKEGGQGKFYNNDGESHTYRIAVTPDNRAFIYRDGMPIDSVRIIDYAPQPYFASGIGEAVENLLKNPDFEGEFDTNPESKLVTAVEGWDVVIGDRWNSEQYIKPEEIDNMQDIDNHIFEIKPYKWAAGWSDGILMQVVDVAPNETYTLSALLKGGIAKKAGTLTGKMIIEEAQNKEKRVVTEIASDNWEMYSMDYTTSADCKQLRISFTVGRGKWGNDIGAIRVDNAKLTGVSCNYVPKFGFVDNTADIEYFAIDESGAYAPMQPTITINLPSK